MYFCEAAPAISSESFFALETIFCSAASSAFGFVAHRGARHDFVHRLLDGGQQRKLSAHGALQQPAGDDEPVDFVGAFEDAVHARVAIGALRRILLDKAVATVNLHGLIDDVVEHLRAGDLDDGALDGILLNGLADGFGIFLDQPESACPSCRRCDRPSTRPRRCRPPSAPASRG